MQKTHKLSTLFTQLMLWLLLAALLLSGCGYNGKPEDESSKNDESAASSQESENEESETEESREDEPRPKLKELSMTVYYDRNTNPLTNGNLTTVQALNILFMPLIDVDNNGEPHPSIARFWNVDGRTLTLTLDGTIKFHDGEPVTADDVIYSIRTISQCQESLYRYCLRGITKYEARENQVIITYSDEVECRPDKLFFPIIPEHYYSKYTAYGKRPIGSGPYMVDTFREFQAMVLVPNPDYYGDIAKIEKITVALSRAEDAPQTAFDSGRDNLLFSDQVAWGIIGNRVDRTLFPYDSDEAIQLVFNLSSSFFKNVKERKAFAAAVDCEGLLNKVYWGYGTVTEGIIGPTLAGSRIISQQGYVPAKQQKIAVPGAPSGETVRILVDSSDEMLYSVAQMMKFQLEADGVSVSFTKKDGKTQWDVALVRRSLNTSTLIGYFTSTGKDNLGGFSDAELDSVLRAYLKTQDIGHAAALESVIAANMPVYTLFFLKKAVVGGRGLTGELRSTSFNRYRGIEYLEFAE